VTGAPAPEFTGFRPAALAFLRALSRHNDRTWFEANRARYEAELRIPMAALVEEVDVRLGTIAPEIVGHPRRSLFRIHRDVRFSSDKRPYKTNVAAWFYHGGGDGTVSGAGRSGAHGGAGFYFDIGPDASSIGGGIWMPPRPTLTRIRARIDEEHGSLERILRDAGVRRRFGGLATEGMLTRMPRGYPDTHPAASLLRHQSFTLGRGLTERELFSGRLPDLLARDFARLVPLVRWLNESLGLRTLAQR
jgi:uncharacterized protein (TIGR02453 family)